MAHIWCIHVAAYMISCIYGVESTKYSYGEKNLWFIPQTKHENQFQMAVDLNAKSKTIKPSRIISSWYWDTQFLKWYTKGT